jgi:hypothetical protein
MEWPEGNVVLNWKLRALAGKLMAEMLKKVSEIITGMGIPKPAEIVVSRKTG